MPIFNLLKYLLFLHNSLFLSSSTAKNTLKAQLQSLKSNESASLATYWVKAHSFGFHWHYHPEIELCYVQRGVGTRMVGDSVREFTEGDLVLVGSNLPHTWISQQYANNAQDNMQVFVVQFLPDLFKDNLLYLPEFQSIASLLKQASQGIFFKDVSRVASLLLAIDQQRGIEKLLGLMRVLHELAAETQIEKLTSKNYTPFLTHENAKRMQNIFGHIHQRLPTPHRNPRTHHDNCQYGRIQQFCQFQ